MIRDPQPLQNPPSPPNANTLMLRGALAFSIAVALPASLLSDAPRWHYGETYWQTVARFALGPLGNGWPLMGTIFLVFVLIVSRGAFDTATGKAVIILGALLWICCSSAAYMPTV